METSTFALDTRIFEGLNDDQRDAVAAVRGPVCILAGAGTGKTTTITRRIANQVATEAFSAGEILAVTFTDKAAREMGTRLGRLSVGGVRAKTFHAEALAQYRRFSGTTPEIVAAKASVLHGIASRLPLPYRYMPLRDLATEIEWAKNRRVRPEGYLDALDGHEPPIPPDLMHRVYVDYERRLAGAGRIDFEDLLEGTLQILTSDERALAQVHARYRAFTVDEYQDVNLLQQQLLEAWVGRRHDLCVVGDDYQSVFGFTGATPRYLLSFAERHPSCRMVTLTANYRSSPEILEVANRLVPGLGGSSKSLRATRQPGPRPELRRYDSGAEEVSSVVGKIRELGRAGTPWEQIAILHRINGRSEDFEEVLAREHIPFQVRDGSFLRRPAARTVLARLRHELDGDVATSVSRILAAAGFDPEAEEHGTDEEATRQADFARLLRLAEEFEGDSIAAFVTDLHTRFAEEDAGRGVLLLTYHRAKGLEFDAVFLPRLEDKELPFALARSPEDLAEERRLLYVGITRARRQLHLSWASSREGERRSKPRPSSFLRELMPADASASALATPARNGAATRVSVPDGDPLFEELRTWRLRVCRESDVPAYVVFDNKTLALIAASRPETRAALLAIPGVGPAKLDRYGAAVLQIVKSA